MKQRVIGGTIYAVAFYLSLLTNNLFYIVLAFFGIFGIYELVKMIRHIDVLRNRILSIVYLCSFIIYICALAFVYGVSPIYIMFFAAVIMLNDTFAYLTGKKFGKTKFSKTSPNKTIEGLIGGVVIGPIFALALFTILAMIFKNDVWIFNFSQLANFNPFNSVIALYIFSLLLAILANVGDLTESYFKRKSHIKDSGTIIYGHGGILDRMDSLIFPMILIAFLMVIGAI